MAISAGRLALGVNERDLNKFNGLLELALRVEQPFHTIWTLISRGQRRR
jgi:hypothetical protein